MDIEIFEEVLSLLAKNGRPDLIQAVRILYKDFLKLTEEDPEYDIEEEEEEEKKRVFTNHEHYEYHEGSAEEEEHYGYAVDDEGHFSLI